MERAILIAVALLTLALWRAAFMVLRQRALSEATPAAGQDHNNLVRERVPHRQPPSMGIMTGSGWSPGFYLIDLVQARSRAGMYLDRVIALTGATQKGDSYFMDVGTTRFQVRDRFIRWVRDSGDPKWGYEETCFYPAFQDMPQAEQIATALLQLRSNPGLFEKWAKKDIAFKANGQLFHRGK